MTEQVRLKKDDKVFIRESFGWHGWRYLRGVVQKVTPSGLVDVAIESAQSTGHTFTERFSPREGTSDWPLHGHRYGCSYYLDREMPFEQRAIFAARQTCARQANNILSEIKWELSEDVDAMLSAVMVIRKKLEAAEKLLKEAKG